MSAYLTDAQVADRYAVTRQWVWLQVKRDCTFPRPIKFTNGCTRFALEDIQTYEEIKKGRASMLCPEGKPLTAGGVQ